MNTNIIFFIIWIVITHQKVRCGFSHLKVIKAYIQEATDIDVNIEYNADTALNFTSRTAKYGYLTEEHTVTTQDGYILKMFRITSGKNCNDSKKNIPVLLQHGLFVNSMSWIDAGPSTGLAYLLADQCYDVWCGNARGTKYSRAHVSLKPTDEDFWKFSFDEIGQYDLKAMVDYILEQTRSQKISFIGHSEGGGTFITLSSTKLEYQKKFCVAITLAPATWMYSTKSLYLRFIEKNYKTVLKAFKELSPDHSKHDALPENVLTITCQRKLVAGSICRLFYKLLEESIDKSVISAMFANYPEPVSHRNIAHYAQLFKKNIFQMIDLGKEENIKKYGLTSPPHYNVSSISTPVVIMYGHNDKIVTKKNLETLRSNLPNVVDFHGVMDPSWNHFDYLFNKNIPTLIAPKITENVKKYC